jgi:hypothetical protein
VGVLVLLLSLFFGLSLADLAIAKTKGGGTANITKQVNLPVPDATATTNGLLASTIQVGGKRFKGSVIRDVNVTLQTTGLSAQSAGQIDVRLTAPNGMTTWLLGNNLAEQSIGPLTLEGNAEHPVNQGGATRPIWSRRTSAPRSPIASRLQASAPCGRWMAVPRVGPGRCASTTSTTRPSRRAFSTSGA